MSYRNIDVTDPQLAAWVRQQILVPNVKIYAVADLPDTDEYEGRTLPVSDGTSARPTATRIGGTWRYPDGTAV